MTKLNMNVNFINIIYKLFYKNVECEANIEEVKLMSPKHKGLKNVISRGTACLFGLFSCLRT